MSIRKYMEGMLPCTAPYLQITVTFSTPTAHYTHYPAPPRSVVIRRVESRTGAVTVVSRWVCDSAFTSSPQSGLTWFGFLFPLIEPGRAVFPHPALGKDSRGRPRKTRGTVW